MFTNEFTSRRVPLVDGSSQFALSTILVVVFFLQSAIHADENVSLNSVIPVVQANCVDCHSGEAAEAGIDLDELDAERLLENPELTRKLIRVVDLGEMPPDDVDPLTDESRDLFVKSFREIFHQSLKNSKRAPATQIRRMNRFQYNNAVTDLFELRCIVFTLPERTLRVHQDYFKPETGKMADVVTVGNRPLGKSQMIEARLAGVAAFPQDLRAEHGFDNQADHLSLSPLLMEAFLKLGQSITNSPDFNPRQVGIWNDFFKEPEQDLDIGVEIRSRLERFLTKAFRKQIDEETLNRYAGYVGHQIESGVAFTDAMKAVAAATIASPRFLYLYQRSNADASHFRDDYELATRLSFFLWGSLPDEELLKLAASRKLSQPEVLSAQLERMLKDRKLKRFCDSFPSQWLQLERLISSVPNREKYPQFYFSKYRDSMHMMLEPLLIFETVLIENQSILQLIDSDFTYRSGLLEDAYQELATADLPDQRKRGGAVTVLKFHRVPVTDRRNGGVITNAAIMTMTSGAERTKPITRGAWVSSVIFNNPPEPPPADVPPLEEKPEIDEKLTLRQQLSLHRQRADCKGCHEKIDPLGFALENYNAIGNWRSQYESGLDVDVAGTLFRRHEFSDVIGFKDAILAEKDRFAKAFAGHLLAFALGRRLEPSDDLAIEQIVENSKRDQYRMKTILQQVVLSEPFLQAENRNESSRQFDEVSN